MTSGGPTKGAELQDDPSRVWSAHPKLAALIRLFVVLAPLGASIIFSWWVGRVAPPDEVGVNQWVWLAALFLAATGVVLVFQRLFRRALPLVALLQLTLVFPDQAPSRARAALRASSGRSLLRRLEAGEFEGEGLDGARLADLLTAINDHDRLTRGHSERVRAYTEVIGDEMGLPKSEMNLLRWGALLHDVGKLTVPAEILNKDGAPNDAEWKVLQGHPTAGGAILEPLSDWLGEWVHAADEHHLHWDGGGYPGGVEGLDISLPGRMVAVADAYDVMTSARSYKKPLSHEVARKELTDCAGTQFDPAVVRVFLNAGLGRLRAAVGPLTWLVNGMSSGQAPIPVASSALSAASAAATAAVAVVASLAGSGLSAPDQLASVALASVVVEDVRLAGTEDRPIEATLTATGPSGAGRFTFGRPAHGAVAIVDGEPGGEATTDDGWGVEVRYRPDSDYHGSDRFTFTACDQNGACGTATATIEIASVNDAPTPAADRLTVTAGETAMIDVAANDRDRDGDPLTVRMVSPPRQGTASVVGDQIEYRAPRAFVGEDVVSYAATDPGGLSGTASLSITVLAADAEPDPTPTTLPPVDEPLEDPPVALPATPPVPTPPEPPPVVNLVPVAVDDGGVGFVTSEDVSFTTADVTANDSDVDDAVVASSVAVVTSVAHGALVDNGDGTFTYTPDPEFFGVDSFTYSITDPNGAVSAPATVSIAVVVVNDAPVAVDDGGVGFVTSEDVSFRTGDVTANDSDLDHAVVRSSVAVVSSVSDGVLVNEGDGTFTYSPGPEFFGTDSFTYTITDGAGAVSAAATVTITVASENDAPVAGDDGGVGFDTAEEVAFTTADVTVNDSDADHPVVASSVAVVSSVSDGVLVNNGDGTFTYTPDPDFFGADSFTYKITDPAGAVSAPATVALSVSSVNDAPEAADDDGVGFATTEDTAFTTADVTANDSDVDHPVVASSVAVVSSVTDGVLVNEGDGTFTYTPDPDFFGTDSFAYTISDPAGAVSAPATVSLGVAPTYDPPVANDDTLTVDPGASATTVDLRLNDSNPDGGPLTVEQVNDGTNGTVLDNGDGTVTYTHDGSGTLSDSFTYTIEDLIGSQSTATVVVTVTPTEDFDGVAAGVDNCPFDFNPMQLDTDGDGVGDVCDPTPTAPSGATLADAGQDLGSGSSLEVALGDIDGDGDLDAVFANDDEPNTVWTNDGAGGFVDSTQTLGTAKSVAVALGDVDGDGDLDLVFANTSTEPNTVWLNDGTGAFTDSGQAMGSSNSEDVAVADVDGDGDLDLAFAELGNDNSVWLNDGSGVFTDSGQSLGSGPTMGVSFADLDGDGDPDLVFANDGADDTVWFNDGTGTFSDSGQALGINRSHGSVLLDLDGDGDVDIAFAGDNGGDTVWLNDGTGTFTDSGQVLGLGHSRAISAGDLDGDGDVDLLFGDHTGSNTVWLNDGTGTFTDSTQTLGNGDTEGTAFGDLDGDGDLDAVTANDEDSNRVWLNS
jgi:hypothetical protein